MLSDTAIIDKSILKYEAIGKGMKIAKHIELSVNVIKTIRASLNDFSLRFSSYVIKGLMLILKREYDSCFRSNQQFIVHSLRNKVKVNQLDRSALKDEEAKRENEGRDGNTITDMSLFNTECLLSDSYDPRLFGKKMLSTPYKEESLLSKSIGGQFGLLYEESGNKTMMHLLNNTSKSKAKNKSIQKYDSNIGQGLNQNLRSGFGLANNNNNGNLISLKDKNSENKERNNDFHDNNSNKNNKYNLYNNELLSDFIDFDIDRNPLMSHQREDKMIRNELQLESNNDNNKNITNKENINDNNNNPHNTTDKKEYITPIKLITSESRPKEILKRFNSNNFRSNKSVKFLLKDQSSSLNPNNANNNANSIPHKTIRSLFYDDNNLLLSPLDITKHPLSKSNSNSKDHHLSINELKAKQDEELQRFTKLFKKVINQSLLTADFNSFKKKLSRVEFNTSLLVSEVYSVLDKDPNESNYNTHNKSKQSSSYEQMRYGDRGDNNSLENSASVVSNLSLKEVFDTNKKLINKTSAVINYPSIVGVIEEEESNFNLNSMNTFNLKSTFNNNNNTNFDLNFDDIHEEERENEDMNNNNNGNYYEELYNQLKIIEHNKAISIDDLSLYITYSCDGKEENNNNNNTSNSNNNARKALVFYHILMYCQRNDVNLVQNKLFSPIYFS